MAGTAAAEYAKDGTVAGDAKDSSDDDSDGGDSDDGESDDDSDASAEKVKRKEKSGGGGSKKKDKKRKRGEEEKREKKSSSKSDKAKAGLRPLVLVSSRSTGEARVRFLASLRCARNLHGRTLVVRGER